MVHSELAEVLEIIVTRFAPERVILFGSRATGLAGPASDYDLCILKSGVEHRRKMAQQVYRSLVGTGLPIDIIVESPSRYDELKCEPHLVYMDIATHGEVLYGKP